MISNRKASNRKASKWAAFVVLFPAVSALSYTLFILFH